jgi:hypothetical protein
MLKIPAYETYHIPHPGDTAHGRAAAIIRSTVPHHELSHYQTSKIQAASIKKKKLKPMGLHNYCSI